tara:strand:- start:240 stop:377 length:138 start_codon:yes stop_codon:yes gene_type:complete
MKNFLSTVLITALTLGSASVFAHCGDADKHAGKTKEEQKEKDKDA